MDTSRGKSENPSPGDVILNRHLVKEILGRTPSWSLCRCRDKKGQEVAIRQISAEALRHLDLEGLRSCVEKVQRFRHRNHVGVAALEHDETGNFYLIRPYAEGDNLDRWLKRFPAAPCERKVAILAQVAEVLDAAHERSLLHRCLKLENVIVDANDQVHVVDFMLPAEIRMALRRARASGAVNGGEVRYKAPELWKGATPSRATDVYAFAVLAYRVLGGSFPYAEKDYFSLGRAVCGKQPPALSGVTDQINAALAKGLAKMPGDRFGTCREFVEALGVRPKYKHAVSLGFPRMRPQALGAVAVLAIGFLTCFLWPKGTGNSHSGDRAIDVARVPRATGNLGGDVKTNVNTALAEDLRGSSTNAMMLVQEKLAHLEAEQRKDRERFAEERMRREQAEREAENAREHLARLEKARKAQENLVRSREERHVDYKIESGGEQKIVLPSPQGTVTVPEQNGKMGDVKPWLVIDDASVREDRDMQDFPQLLVMQLAKAGKFRCVSMKDAQFILKPDVLKGIIAGGENVSCISWVIRRGGNSQRPMLTVSIGYSRLFPTGRGEVMKSQEVVVQAAQLNGKDVVTYAAKRAARAILFELRQPKVLEVMSSKSGGRIALLDYGREYLTKGEKVDIMRRKVKEGGEVAFKVGSGVVGAVSGGSTTIVMKEGVAEEGDTVFPVEEDRNPIAGIVCPHCKGQGKEQVWGACRTCEGKGKWWSQGAGSSRIQRTCGVCGGKGSCRNDQPCSKCQGTGRVFASD